MPIHALVFEENELARSFLLRVLRESFSDELEFTEAASVDEARQALHLGGTGAHTAAAAARDFRLILCDLEQHDGGGLELLAELKSHPAVKIATTLHSDDEHLFPALQCGASGYLLKEDRFEVLVEELQRILQGQPPLSPAMARCLLGFFREPMPTLQEAAVSAPKEEREVPYLPPAPAPDVFQSRQPTHVEREVLTWLSKGYTLKEIARKMGIKGMAVNAHIGSVYRKLADASSAPPPSAAAA